MNNPTSVDNLYNEYLSVKNGLCAAQMISEASAYSNTMRKVLVLACGSFFEYEMTEMLKRFTFDVSGNSYLTSFVENQAIKQKYHTLFDWGAKDQPDAPSKSAKKFFSLFGNDFSEKMKKQQDEDSKLYDAVCSFLELGHLRNILVHSNFANYTYEQKTVEDIYDLFKKAMPFIPWVSKELQQKRQGEE